MSSFPLIVSSCQLVTPSLQLVSLCQLVVTVLAAILNAGETMQQIKQTAKAQVCEGRDPRGRAPFGQHQESRPLCVSNFRSMRIVIVLYSQCNGVTVCYHVCKVIDEWYVSIPYTAIYVKVMYACFI